MRQLYLQAPNELHLRLTEDPQPGPGEVVVAVKAAALNFFDTLIIQGRYQTKPAFPFSPSAECAGTIAAIGEGVTGWRIVRWTSEHIATADALAARLRAFGIPPC